MIIIAHNKFTLLISKLNLSNYNHVSQKKI